MKYSETFPANYAIRPALGMSVCVFSGFIFAMAIMVRPGHSLEHLIKIN